MSSDPSAHIWYGADDWSCAAFDPLALTAPDLTDVRALLGDMLVGDPKFWLVVYWG